MKTFYFLRHGQTDYNARDLFQGRVDQPLNPKGIKEAEYTASLVKDMNLHFDYVISSPSLRAQQTCRIVSGCTDIRRDERLYEIAYGSYEGTPVFHTDEVMQVFLRDPWNQDPPDGVESLYAIKERTLSFFDDMLNEINEGETVLVSSHGIALYCLFRGIGERTGKTIDLFPDHGCLYCLSVNEGQYDEPYLCIHA